MLGRKFVNNLGVRKEGSDTVSIVGHSTYAQKEDGTYTADDISVNGATQDDDEGGFEIIHNTSNW